MDSDNDVKLSSETGDVCRDFLRKVCNRGNNCKFLHPESAEKKLEFCHDFQNSICMRHGCRFIHRSRVDECYYLANGHLPANSIAEIGGSDSRGRPPSPGDIDLCRDFLKGKCTRGASCKLRHQQGRGDSEYERSWEGPRRRGGWGNYDDIEYDFDRSRRSLDAFRTDSRYERPMTSLLDFERPSSSTRDLEDDNARLRQNVELLRKQVDELTATNEVLLQQNAQLRTGKREVAQMHLAMFGQ